MTAFLSGLLNEPTLPEIVSDLQRTLTAERALHRKFYEEITPEMKAEFINGEVVMHSPATALQAEVRKRLSIFISNFVDFRSLGVVFDVNSLCTFPRNDYEPDVIYFGPKKARGIKPDTLQFPPPDFVCEVLSSSTEKTDRGVKFRDYEAHGVTEYWIVDPKKRTLEQYVITRGKRYELRLKSKTGEVVSAAIKGLRLPIQAIFDAKVHRTVLREMFA